MIKSIKFIIIKTWDNHSEISSEFIYEYDDQTEIMELNIYINSLYDDIVCTVLFANEYGYSSIPTEGYVKEFVENNYFDLYIFSRIGPIGGLMETIQNYKIIINSKEENHRNEPHVHIKNDNEEFRIRLTDFTIMDNNHKKPSLKVNKKTLNKIIGYLKTNQKWLLNQYNEIVNHNDVSNIVIDIVSEPNLNEITFAVASMDDFSLKKISLWKYSKEFAAYNLPSLDELYKINHDLVNPDKASDFLCYIYGDEIWAYCQKFISENNEISFTLRINPLYYSVENYHYFRECIINELEINYPNYKIGCSE